MTIHHESLALNDEEKCHIDRGEHEGEQLWVVRKGATPPFPGQLGFVGGTMGEH
jgi:hypothetical protein